MDLPDILHSRILVLDGAMGTMIQRYKLSESDFHSAPFSSVRQAREGDNECLNLTHPEIIESIHRSYIDAGADIIECNTFSANRISQSVYGCEAFAAKMAYEGVRIARKVADEADRKVWVAGSLGLTSKSLSLASDLNNPASRTYSFDQMADAFAQQIEQMIKAGADLIQIETCFDALNAKAAIYALEKVHNGFPLIVSVSVNDKSGRTLTGQTLEAFYTSVRHYPFLAFGLNCSPAAEDLLPLVKEVATFTDRAVICHPNAGMPSELGGYEETPEKMAKAVRTMAQAGLVNIIGGCCGTTPDHIKAIANAVKGLPPRTIVEMPKRLTVSGLEAVTVDLEHNNFTNIGERTNVAGSRKFAKLIAAGDYDTALQIASDQIENGANIIDINMDDAMLNSPVEMEKFVRFVENDPSVAKAALMIDSSHWESILAGLKNAQGKCIVNSISLKEGEEAFITKAQEINRLGGAMVVMAFDEQGQATTYERKISICERAYKLLTLAGIPANDIIFDVNVLSVGTGIEEHSRYAVDFIEAVRWIKHNLKGAYTSGGISNLSFAFRGNNKVREAMHSAFLYHAIEAGLDMGIVNPGMLEVYSDIEPGLLKCVEDVILDKDSEATDRLIAKAQSILEADTSIQSATPTEVSPKSPEERLIEHILKGKNENIEKDVMECYQGLGSAVKVIEGPLMNGMEKVGELFGSGKMFLPQVVKSAKVMKDCVNVLQPYMSEGQSEDTIHKPKIVMATVKGDVHDIGKNITGIVLSCNGFEVIDLGVMVEIDRILSEAEKVKADIIAVSGLITPSLYQMELLCKEMTARKMDTPLFIGGATTSALHTAVKLAPCYDHVFYGSDASTSAILAKRCILDRVGFELKEHTDQQKLRDLYNKRNFKSDEKHESPTFEAATYLKKDQYDFEDTPTTEVPINDVIPFFDWRMFLALWGIKYSDKIPDDPTVRKTIQDAKELLADGGKCVIKMATRFFSAWEKEDTLYLGDSNMTAPDESLIVKKLPMLRQGKSAIVDFVPDVKYGITGPCGIFAISVWPTQTTHPV